MIKTLRERDADREGPAGRRQAARPRVVPIVSGGLRQCLVCRENLPLRSAFRLLGKGPQYSPICCECEDAPQPRWILNLARKPTGDFARDIVYTNNRAEILRLSECAPFSVHCKTDCGRLVPILPELRIKRNFRGSNPNLAILRHWVEDYERRGIPFAVVRVSDHVVKLYKERRCVAGGRVQYEAGRIESRA